IAVELPPIEKPADSVEAVASIAAAVAAGDLTATEAAQLAKIVDVYVRALDSKGFDERLSKLEQEIGGAPNAPEHARRATTRPSEARAHAAARELADKAHEKSCPPAPHASAVGERPRHALR